MSKTPFFIRIVRPTYGKWLLLRHRVRTADYAKIPKEGPFLILSNHAHVYDPFLISSSLPIHVRWVAGAYLFKNQVVSLLLGRWIGGIAKQQGRSDLQTIRDISAAFKQGEVVGLFPEGTRTWDGEPYGFDVATAKLVRLFNVPVVLLNLEGAYALKPRWARFARKGYMTIRVVRILMPDEMKAMKVADIMQVLEDTLGFSHTKWEAEHRIPYVSPKKAVGLEKLLYLCPSCGGRSTIRTKGDRVYCDACDLHFKLDPYDDLVLVSGNPNGIASIPAWHAWERAELGSIRATHTAESPLFPPDRGVLFQHGVDNRLLTLSRRFSLTLEPTRLVVNFPKVVPSGILQGLQSIIFDFSRMQSMIINAKGTVEFFHDDELWRIRIVGERSIVKYVELFTDWKKLYGNEDSEEERA